MLYNVFSSWFPSDNGSLPSDWEGSEDPAAFEFGGGANSGIALATSATGVYGGGAGGAEAATLSCPAASGAWIP